VEFRNTTGSAEPPGDLQVFTGDDACSTTSTLVFQDTSGIDPEGGAGIRRLSFTAAGATTFFRTRLANPGPPTAFSYAWSDTTMFSPAWSSNGPFDTFYSFLNTTNAELHGTLMLLDTAGTVLSTLGLIVPSGRTASTNTLAVGVARNCTGTARFTHAGPPGAFLAEAAIANFSLSVAYVQPVQFQAVREAR